MKKLQTGIATLLLLGGIFGLISQHRSIAELRETNASLQMQLGRRTEESVRLSQTRAAIEAEVLTLRADVATLKIAAMAASHPVSPSIAAPVKIPGSQTGTALPPVADNEANRKKKAQYRQRYDPFFAQREYTPEQIERILELFILQDDAQADLQASVREVGLNGNTTGIEDLRSKLYAPIMHELQEIMGNDGYAAYNRFQASSYYRLAFVDRILPVFISANSALTPAQIDLLVTIVAENDRPVKKSPTDIGSESRIDWDKVASKTHAFLNAQQQAAFQSYISSENARRR